MRSLRGTFPSPKVVRMFDSPPSTAVDTGPVSPASTVLSVETVSGLLVLVGVFFAVLMGAMDGLVVSTVLPRIASDLHQSDGVTFVVSAYLISSTISIPIFARLADIASRRNVFLVGIGIFIVGSALAGLSQNLPELIVFRGMQGFGGGGVFPVAVVMVAVLFPPETRARIIGVISGAAGLAIILGPLVGNAIVSLTTWRWVFYINLPFGFLAVISMLVAVGPLRPAVRGAFDYLGTVLLSGWVAALMFALVQVSDSGWAWTDPRIIGLLAGAFILFGTFVWHESRSPHALVPLHLLRQRVVAASGGAMLFTGIVFSSMLTFLSLLVGLVLLHDGPNSTADVRDIIYFLAIPLIIGAASSGQILSRVSYRALVAPGLGVAGVVGLLLTHLTPSTPLWVFAYGFLPVGGIALPLIPMGFGLGLSLAGVTIAVQNEAPPEEVGAAIGITRFLQSLGGALGISLLTVFLSWRIGVSTSGATSAAAVESGLVTAYSQVFLVIAVCILIAFAFSLFLTGRVPQTPESPQKESPPTPLPGAAGAETSSAR
jgi:EmrB/QacA subfamily drug resistance transporter